MTQDNNQIKKWILPKPINNEEIHNCNINYILQKVLSRRGINIIDELDDFISPKELPNPNDHFDELDKATKRIIDACNKNEKIAICGDYDADGITSTVLLIELLNILGANALAFIPSRMDDGYGLNKKMINEIYLNDIKLVITVDNGISAFDAMNRSKELGIDLIITDHHKITRTDLDVFALIHPEKSPLNSPYKYLAGVGISYMLAYNICKIISFDIDNTSAKLFFCIGTVADMAPLLGANRKWLKEYLPAINSVKNCAIKSIINKLSIDNKKNITTEDIGFKIAPLINAVGRIGDPKLIIDLLTTKSQDLIKTYTNECFEIHKKRKRITTLIEKEAMVMAMNELSRRKKFLVLVNPEWHPGIIGIVAARVVEKYNLPTAILSCASDGIFRGSIRSNNIVKVNLALEECKDFLCAYGGHSAAAGFSIEEEYIPLLADKLNNIATREMQNIDMEKSIKPDACISLDQINDDFYSQLILIGPFGMLNPAPIFWTRKCRIIDLYKLKGNHIKMKIDDGTSVIDAIKWNTSINLKINDLVDIAFYIELNNWKNKSNLQLNIIDIKKYYNSIDLIIHNKVYKCVKTEGNNISITNDKGNCIKSDLLNNSDQSKSKQYIFAKKILSFAEIALGEVV